MDIAKRLANLRRKHRYTQQQIADYLGISRGAYANYEIGNREPDASTLAKLAQMLEVSTDWLLTGKEPTSSPSEEQEFTEWLKENMGDDLFFYEFNKSPEEMKQEAIETFRAIWEIEKKKAERRKGKE
ncbi:helix-turn-helix transcriptional regulator [Alicyclobacillus fastidiosus]|uniref:Helix-turn-helix transcriptional regulator n=1 Tax=Alicyclobacillus fastidiosus TaxID=392011 RepID=A0ABY6ZIY6_9BACL|nr:helix-turn-helix transcriptional regulator [Alicyclobacillus fastidiosus]WAH42796.1 helix-turn-helix transcriptional regulator [Alicyclobacillus fastidiosus]GMA64717.1 transcriptional regulator [Alicyclobacillus fastidiosus]